MRKLHESGFLAGWRLGVNPRIWGGGWLGIAVDVDPKEPKGTRVEELKLLPGALIVNSFQSRIAVVVGFEDEAILPRQIELVCRLCGSTQAVVGIVPFPDSHAELSARDWDLIRALRRDPRRSPSAVARETGMSSRTVARRLARLVREGVAFLWSAPDPRGVEGGVLAAAFVTVEPGHEREVDALISEHLEPYHWHTSHFLAYGPHGAAFTGYELVLPNVSAVRDVLTWVSQVRGVLTARVDMFEEIFTDFAAYDEFLEGRLRAMPTAVPSVTMAPSLNRVLAPPRKPRRPRRPTGADSVRWSGT